MTRDDYLERVATLRSPAPVSEVVRKAADRPDFPFLDNDYSRRWRAASVPDETFWNKALDAIAERECAEVSVPYLDGQTTYAHKYLARLFVTLAVGAWIGPTATRTQYEAGFKRVRSSFDRFAETIGAEFETVAGPTLDELMTAVAKTLSQQGAGEAARLVERAIEAARTHDGTAALEDQTMGVPIVGTLNDALELTRDRHP